LRSGRPAAAAIALPLRGSFAIAQLDQKIAGARQPPKPKIAPRNRALSGTADLIRAGTAGGRSPLSQRTNLLPMTPF
jgi:hypothetical protein